MWKKKHPHVRGEDPRRKRRDVSRVGNTPTCVGKTLPNLSPEALRQKHPHVRGEDLVVSAQCTQWAETPPRAWGRHILRTVPRPILRNTPTCVGKTTCPSSIRSSSHETPPRAWGRLEISTDGGKTFGDAQASAEQVVVGTGDDATGATLIFPADAVLEADAEFAVTVRCAVGPVERMGEAQSPLVTVAVDAGGVLAGAELVVQIVKGGGRNEGTYQLSTDGGDNFERVRTIPVDGTVELAGFGVSVTFPDGTYTAGTTYACRVLAPTPSIMDVMDALESPLALYDVEFVHIAGETDSVDWTAAQTKAEELWNLQRPTYFKMETRLPHDGEDLNDFAAYLLAEKQGFAGRFVTVCCQYGEITDSTGASRLRNAGGLQAGRVMSIPVQRATGRVKDGPVSQLTLPEGWEAVQSTLEDAGYLTAKKYAGLDGVYWGDSRTMADATSDYRYEEVLRTVFKAVRLMRIAALKSMYDEAGDPLRPDSATGLAYLQASLENALDTMVKANPKELAGYVVDIAPKQDIANNGVAVDITLIGIGIIRQIKLYPRYVYAGSTFDPRMSEAA